jgi:hypothetical protein
MEWEFVVLVQATKKLQPSATDKNVVSQGLHHA